MKLQVLGSIIGSLLIPVGVAVVVAAFGVVMVMQAYGDDSSTGEGLVVIGAGLIVAAIPVSVSIRRTRFGPLTGSWRILTGVSGAVLLGFCGYILIFEQVKWGGLVILPVALGVLYLAAEVALLACGVANPPDAP